MKKLEWIPQMTKAVQWKSFKLSITKLIYNVV